VTAIENLNPERQDVVRNRVRELLMSTDAWKRMPPDERKRLANGMVNVVAFLADPAAGQQDLARALERTEKTGADKTMDRLAKKQDLVGKDFVAAGMRAGAEGYKQLVDAVDFPQFVSGLIEGVFTSIVNSSIRQMNAYSKLLEAVVKNVEQYAADHVSMNQARDYLQDRFPDALTVKTDGGAARLALRDGADDDVLKGVRGTLGIEDEIDLDDEEGEAKLAQRAQLEMARVRQQQLATMVLLGINRIVVTDGLINAKVVIDVRASDTAQRANRASMYDDKQTARQSGSGGGWFSSDYDNSQESHRTVVSSAMDDTSESKAQMKANLTGEVRVNFKSETFPLEKMASMTQIASVNERAQK
jgi:hypothetical protein